jgi:hypothetical protein
MIPYNDMESKWYTQEEQRHFNQAFRSDIRMLRDMLRDAAPVMICEDILCECVGIENYLTPCIARHVVLKKQAHSEAVLSAQVMHLGNHRIEKLRLRES